MKMSIIMPSFNQGKYVRQAIQSILDQDYADKEIIFIDGGSTDNTMDVVEEFSSHISYIVSESDRGQSDALSKGFQQAKGDFFSWLNTDDILLPGALTSVANLLKRDPKCEWVLGNVIWVNADGNILRCWKGEDYSRFASPQRAGLTAGGPSAFFSKSLYERCGGVNLDMHYQMDTEMWWRFAMSGAKFRRTKQYLWALRLHEDAKVSGHLFAQEGDERQQRTALAQSREAEHIKNLTQSYRMNWPVPMSNVVRMSRRIMSKNYWQGRVDNLRYQGTDINKIEF